MAGRWWRERRHGSDRRRVLGFYVPLGWSTGAAEMTTELLQLQEEALDRSEYLVHENALLRGMASRQFLPYRGALKDLAAPELSKDEKELLSLVKEGVATKEIARQFRMPYNTVWGRIEALAARLGMTTEQLRAQSKGTIESVLAVS